MRVLHALATPDGRYRVEVIQRGPEVHYRLLRDGSVWHKRAAIASIEYFLGEEGISMADLAEVDPARMV